MKKKTSAARAKKARPAKAARLPTGGEVDAFVGKLKHPLLAEIEAARRTILGADASIAEGIKWNSPSFRTTEYFATTNLRALDQVQFVFHLGAKARAQSPKIEIADPAGLVKWLAKDRCLVTVGAGREFAAKREALREIVRQWIKYV